MKQFIFPLVVTIIAGVHCIDNNKSHSDLFSTAHESQSSSSLINSPGNTIETRFNLPEGFKRVTSIQHSFGDYLQHLPLKTSGSKVKYFNGQEKEDNAYIAVVNMDIGKRDLQQCADAVMRLRGEYFYQQKKYDSISFPLTNGFVVDYSKWMAGNRIHISGNQTSWTAYGQTSNTYHDFRNYMDVVFTYAGTLSLSKTLHSKRAEDIAIGDVFIVGGSPGHAIIVVDMALNKKGEKLFMLAQSYMPAQDIQVLKNPGDKKISPWYQNNFTDKLITPEWVFTKNQLKTW